MSSFEQRHNHGTGQQSHTPDSPLSRAWEYLLLLIIAYVVLNIVFIIVVWLYLGFWMGFGVTLNCIAIGWLFGGYLIKFGGEIAAKVSKWQNQRQLNSCHD